ncbi:MAG: polymer-forming cytoskeletal protein [Acidobacteriota bacterium]|nr:polymer-forming cytoskeletal protein [Acidobacteriota bacterium]
MPERNKETFSPGATPVSPAATPKPYSTAPGPDVAMIGRAMTIIGQIQSRQDMYIDGDVQGSLELEGCRLTVGPNGKADAGAKAREIIILGSVNGDVDASDKLAVRQGGRLVGNIRTAGVIIEDGAYFKGSIDIVKRTGEPNAAEPVARAAGGGNQPA